MGKTTVEPNVPENMVEDVVDQYKADGATRVERVRQPDGKYTVVAIYPNGEHSK